jgi:hypothetical protein
MRARAPPARRAPRRRSPARRRSQQPGIADGSVRPSRPASSSSTRSAMSSCRNSTRSAEQRWPALLNAEASHRAPPARQGRAVDDHRVLAAGLGDQRAIGASRAASARLISRAVSVEPVKATPATRGSGSQRAPTVAPSPGSKCSTSPARRLRAAARPRCRDQSGVCSAGLASTALPAASAAATWPVKIASGKFHGLMQANTPRPCSTIRCSRRSAPAAAAAAEVRPGARARSSAGSPPPRAPRRAVGHGLAGLAHAQRHQFSPVFGSKASAARSRMAARSRRPAVPGGLARPRGASASSTSVSRRPRAPRRPSRRAIAGFATSRRAAFVRRPRPPGAARQGFADGGISSPSASSFACLRGSCRFSPRSSAAPRRRARGSGMRGCGIGRRTRPRPPDRRRSRRPARARHDAVDEGGVGAVLQQPAHQVGQQVLVAADRRVDAAGRPPSASHPS